MEQTAGARRRDIQGLRALAVAAVVAAHVFGWPGGGYLGVDVFFVISGFVITAVLLRDRERSGRVGLGRFYARRARRILPLAMVVIALTLAASTWGFSPARAATTRADGVWAVFFAANWRFVRQGADYFALGQQPSPLQHYWSLGVEEQFYLLWPLLALLTFGVLGRRAAALGRWLLAGFAVVIVFLSLAWAVVQTSADATTAYFSSLTRAWEIGLGCLLALVPVNRLGAVRGPRLTLAAVGVLGILSSFVLVGPGVGAPFPGAVWPALATGLVLLAGAGTSPLALPPLTSWLPVRLGDISYGLYLWHFPLLVVLAAVGDATAWTTRVLVVALTLALATASHLLLERPVLDAPSITGSRRGSRADWGRWYAARRLGAAAGLAALVVAAAGTAAVAHVDPALLGSTEPVADSPVAADPTAIQPSAVPTPEPSVSTTTVAGVSTTTVPSPTSSTPTATHTPKPTPTLAPVIPLGSTGRALQAGLRQGLAMSSWPGNLDPPMSQFWLTGNSDPAYKACVATVASNPSSCTFGKRSGAEIVVYGDSLGINLLKTVVTAYGSEHKVRGLTKLACAVNGVDADFGKDEWAVPCVNHRQMTIAYVKKARPDVLIMVENYGWSLKLKSGAKGAAAGREWQAADQAFVRAVGGSVKHVIILTPSISGIGITDCYRAGGSPRRCVTGIPPWWQTTHDAERAVQGVTYIDTLHWWCADGRCPIVTGIDDTVMKTDYLHASVQYNRLLAPDLRYLLGAAGVLKG